MAYKREEINIDFLVLTLIMKIIVGYINSAYLPQSELESSTQSLQSVVVSSCSQRLLFCFVV